MTIAALDNLRGRQLAVVVTVAGLTDRYFCGPAPDVSAVPGTGGALTYRDINALLDMGAESSSIEEVECTVTQSPVVVRLAARDAPISAATVFGSTYSADPVRTLRRIGPAGATLRTTIAGTVPHELGPTDIDTTDDVSAWPPGLYHIGLETVYPVGGAVGAQLQSCLRGAAHTRIARHLYQPTRGYQPSITSEPTFWRGRRATVEAAPVVGGARVGSYVEIWRGVLDREPELSSDGMTLTLRIAPLSALMRQRFAGGAVSTTLVRGWHYFTPRVGAEIRLNQIWERGAAVEAAYDENGGHADTTQAARYAHERIFDVTLPMGHPRAGDVELYNNTLRIVHRVVGYIGNDRLDVDPVAIPLLIGSEGDLTTPYLNEECTLSLVDPAGAPEIVRWPDRALAVISGALPAAVAWNTTWNACDRWRVVTNQGQLGRWASVELSQNGAGWLWRAGLVEPGMGGATLVLRWGPVGPRICVGVDYRAPDDAVAFIDIEQREGAIRSEAISNATAEARAQLPCRGPALAWFHSVEPALLVVDDVYAGGSPQLMRISGGEVNFSTGAFDVMVTASTPALDPDTGALIGYLLTVSEVSSPDLYALDHGTPVTVTPRARSLGVAPSTLLLRLLESGAGTGTNGVYDVLAYGANLDASDIAESAFLSFAVPDALQGSDFAIDPTKSVDETLRDVLTLLGGAVVQRWVDGRQRLTLTSLAPAHDAESVMAITDADLLTDGQCASSIDGRVVRAYRLESDHDAAGVAQRITTYVDSDAVTAAGGDAGEQLALDLRGIRFDGDPADVAVAILPIVQHLRRRAGAPRVRYQVAVSVDHPGALEVGLGDVVTLTCSSAIGIDGSIGITAQACRVLGVERDWLQGRVALTLASAGMRAAGWSPSLRVRDVLSPLIVRVEDNVYTDTTEPRTGEAQNDIERTSLKYFAIGDSVRCVPAGDYAAAVQRTIVDRVIGLLEFDAPHGLQPGDDIDHASWGAASAAARAYAYLDRGLRIG